MALSHFCLIGTCYEHKIYTPLSFKFKKKKKKYSFIWFDTCVRLLEFPIGSQGPFGWRSEKVGGQKIVRGWKSGRMKNI